MSERLTIPVRQIDDALKGHAVVRYRRDRLDDAGICSYGVPLARSDEWLLTHYMGDHLRLDGFDAVRIRDLSEFSADFEKSAFLARCVEVKRQTPALPIGICLDDTRSMLESIVARYPLVVIHRERVCSEECEVGVLKMVSDGIYVLRWMTPAAQWADDEEVYRFDDVTRVTFGSEYETTLAVIAGLIDNPW